MKNKIVIVGGGVSGFCAATKLVDNGYPGELITIIDKGKDAYRRLPEEVMCGALGCGGWSDGKLTYHTSIGGQLKKYCGEEKAMSLMDEVIENFKRFHPNPSIIMKSDPQEEPDFIKPHFGLRLFPVWHIGSDYLHEIGKKWYEFLCEKGVGFNWECEITDINFKDQNLLMLPLDGSSNFLPMDYDTLIFAVGKSGIDFTQNLINEYKLPTEPKSVQIGVRFEAPMKYFQRLIDISYDFKLYQKPSDKISLRSFCTNNEAAYVAVEETYGDVSYNGHALKDPKYKNDMTNFGILMEIKGIDDPFEWAREVVKKCQAFDMKEKKKIGLYYSPSPTRKPSKTSEGNYINAFEYGYLDSFKEIFGEYAEHILKFIDDLNTVFNIDDDWGIYIPEVKYLSPEPQVAHSNLSLLDYPNVHFVGDALSARGISVSGAQGIYVAEYLLNISNNGETSDTQTSREKTWN